MLNFLASEVSSWSQALCHKEKKNTRKLFLKSEVIKQIIINFSHMYTIVYGREGERETLLKYSLEILARSSRLRLRLDFTTSYLKSN